MVPLWSLHTLVREQGTVESGKRLLLLHNGLCYGQAYMFSCTALWLKLAVLDQTHHLGLVPGAQPPGKRFLPLATDS